MVHQIFLSVRRCLRAHRRKFFSGLILSVALITFSAADQPAGTKVWDFYTGASIQSSAAIGQHGIVYFGTDSGKLYSFYPDGRGIWEYPTGESIVGSPAIADDGLVIFGSTDGILYAVEPGGLERWRFQANGPIASSPAIGPDGTIVFGSMSKRLFALRPDGSKLWDLESSAPIVGSPAISKHGVVYVAGADGTLAAISVQGDVLWQFDAPNSIVSSPAIGADGTVYFGCFDGHVYALSAVGKKLWTYATGGPVKSSPAVGPDGVIYIGSDDKLLYALAPDGFKKWTFSMGAAIRSTPAVAADGTVYVGSYDNSLYAISANGTKQWEFVTDEDVTSSPAIGSDGTVYFGSWNGRFYAVKGTTGLAAGVWPRFRGNAAQNGYRGSTQVTPTTAPAVSVAANNRVEPVARTRAVKRSGNSWWDRVFGSGSPTAKNRGVIGGGASPRQVARAEVPEPESKVISDARQLMNVENTTVAPSPAPTTTVVRAETTAPTTMAAPPVSAPMETTTIVAAPSASSGALPMMPLVGGGNSAVVPAPAPVTSSVPPVTTVPVIEPLQTNVPEPVPPKSPEPVAVVSPPVTSAPTVGTMRMTSVPAPSANVTTIQSPPVRTPAPAPVVSKPETTIVNPPSVPVNDRGIPMMRLIESGGAGKTSSVISETGVSKVTFGTTTAGVGVQTISTDVVEVGTSEISMKETTTVTSIAPAPKPVKPVSVSANIREAQYVPGVIKSWVTGAKRRGKDPNPPAPDVTDVSLRERNYQPGFLQRLVRPDTRPVTKKKDKSTKVETPPAKTGSKSAQAETKPKKNALAEKKVAAKEKKTEVGGSSAVISVETVESDADEPNTPLMVTAVEMKDPAPAKPSTVASVSGKPRVISDSSELFGPDGEPKAESPQPVVKVAAAKSPPVQPKVAKSTKAAKMESTVSTPTVDEKIAAMESRVEALSAEVVESRRERDELKQSAAPTDPVVARTVANLQPKPEPKVVEPEERILPASDTPTEQALNAVYGDKLSRLESHLISLNTELADARVERARLRKELEAARTGQTIVAAPATVSRATGNSLANVPKVAPPTTERVDVVARPETASIPQPEWLKQEIRSVLAAAGEQWEQPPGAGAAASPASTAALTTATTPSVPPTPATAPSVPGPDSSAVAVAETAASAGSTALNVPDAEASKPKLKENRRPGFLSRLFGRKPEPQETRIAATNIVMVPPKVGDFPGAPTDAQLLGNDPTFGLELVPTNFPRVPYTPDTSGSFIQPGAGNVTQLPGFPRAQPKLVSPPIREMAPNLKPGPGLRDVNVDETIALAGNQPVRQLPAPADKPQVVIVSPPDNAQLTKPVLDLRGMVKSRRRVAEVLVSVGGSEFVPAAGLDNWSHQVPISRGLVLVRVKAVDVDGRPSEIETRTFHYHARSRMTVKVVGQGAVSPDLNRQELIIGQPYTITAQPAAGQEFVGWSGAVSGSQPTVSFVMNKDLWLQAEFRPQAPPIVPGRFTGLVHPRDEIRADRSGYIELRVDAEGKYIGALHLAGATHPLRGRFDSQWQASESVTREGLESIALALRMDRANGGESLTGYFELAGEPVIVRGFRTLDAGGTLTVLRPGTYRILMPAPEQGAAGPGGAGFGEATVTADGRLEFSFQLPDGTPAKQSAQLSRQGVWPLYVPLYGGRGALAGWISSTDKAEFSLYGEVRWLKPAGDGNQRGFAVARMMYGTRSVTPSASVARRSPGALVATR